MTYETEREDEEWAGVIAAERLGGHHDWADAHEKQRRELAIQEATDEYGRGM